MRIITFQNNGSQYLGVRDGDSVIDLSRADPGLPTELIDLINLGQSGLDQASKAVANADQSA